MEELTFKKIIQKYNALSKIKKSIFIIALLQLFVFTIIGFALSHNNLIEVLLKTIYCYIMGIFLPYRLYIINNTKIFYVNLKDFGIN
jgi:hypothetical protein